MVWMYTNGVDPKIPTARRRARFLGLGTPLAGTFVDVPTTPWGKGDITSFHMRERPRGKLRLTALRGISLMNVMSAAQHHSSSFVHLTTAVRPSDGVFTAVTAKSRYRAWSCALCLSVAAN